MGTTNYLENYKRERGSRRPGAHWMDGSDGLRRAFNGRLLERVEDVSRVVVVYNWIGFRGETGETRFGGAIVETDVGACERRDPSLQENRVMGACWSEPQRAGQVTEARSR